MKKNSTILVAGANGLIGRALIKTLKQKGYINLVQVDRERCDLTNFDSVKELFAQSRPEYVFHLAALVYGIGGNQAKKGEIFLGNVLINTHVIEACRLVKVKKIVAMGTIATYPEPKTVPVKEDSIWEGVPHESESSYGHAKRAMLAQLLAYQESYNLDFAYVLSTNLYGPYDKFDVHYGHVIPSLIKKFYDAKQSNSNVTVWGDGSASRDFMYSEDMAKALVEIMLKSTGPINVATGKPAKIKDVVNFLADHLGMQNKIIWDDSKPNGRKYHELDLSLLSKIGFKPEYTLKEGLIETYEWFASTQKTCIT